MPSFREDNLNHSPVSRIEGRETISASGNQLSNAEAFKQRLLQRASEKGQLTQIDELQSLYASGDQEQLDTHIDDLVYEALTSDEEFMSNVNTLKAARQAHRMTPDLEESIRARQNELFNEYKKLLVNIAGLPDQLGIDEYELAKERVAGIVKSSIEAGKTEDVLKNLGILSLDEKGDEIFTYPNDLFPSETNKKWELYLDKVRTHLRKERGVMAGTLEPVELESADNMRRLAHNSVTQDVHSILGFDKMPGTTWTFAETRNLIAKMRDRRYPTVETAEKAKTSDQVLKAANVLGVLGTKIAGMK